MKRYIATSLIAVITTLILLAIMGQGRDDWRYGGTINGKLSIRDSLTVGTITTLRGRVVASSPDFSTIDSFLTTAAVDTITMNGADVGDVFVVTEITPTWSSTPDTGAGNYRAWVISANKVVVGRTKRTPASTLKSGAIYAIVKFDK
jgi:hypothetical protein